MQNRTRIKICGLTRVEDIHVAVEAGVDALGFVFYPKSPRYVSPSQAANLLAAVPPFVTTVGLFVNAPQEEVAETLAQAPVSLLQFHGDETTNQCAAFAQFVRHPFIRALRVGDQARMNDLIEYERECQMAGGALFSGLLLDALSENNYGGNGVPFDWSLLSSGWGARIILSGGLDAHNVGTAIRRVRPYAVDVSSGVEYSKGIKDPLKIRQFVNAVRAADWDEA